MATDLAHAVGFLQTAYTILLALSFGEAFKQFVAEQGPIEWTRLPSLSAFLFMIFPFFHGMSRYLYTTYLVHGGSLGPFAAYLMFDGIIFVFLSSLFFVMSRSLSTSHWQRFYVALLLLLLVDSIWIAVALHRGIELKPWLILNGILAAILIGIRLFFRRENSIIPPVICAVATLTTTVLSYYYMREFYFP